MNLSFFALAILLNIVTKQFVLFLLFLLLLTVIFYSYSFHFIAMTNDSLWCWHWYTRSRSHSFQHSEQLSTFHLTTQTNTHLSTNIVCTEVTIITSGDTFYIQQLNCHRSSAVQIYVICRQYQKSTDNCTRSQQCSYEIKTLREAAWPYMISTEWNYNCQRSRIEC